MNETIDTKEIEKSDCAVLITGVDNGEREHISTRCQIQGDRDQIAIMAATFLEQLEELGLIDLVYDYHRNQPKRILERQVNVLNRNGLVS